MDEVEMVEKIRNKNNTKILTVLKYMFVFCTLFELTLYYKVISQFSNDDLGII